MQRFTDQQYLTKDQYKDSSNLDARIAIHQRFSTNPQGWYHWIFDILLGLPQNANVLELGCGAGTMWKECADKIPSGWVITLTDLSDGMLDSAWRNLVPLGRSFKFEKADAQTIPYNDDTFDVVIANHMLYHVPDRKKALAEIKRVLKDDGCLIATTVGENHMKEMYQWLRRVNTNLSKDMFSNPFTLESGVTQLKEVFSKVEKAQYVDNLRVAELEPLMSYILSSISLSDVSVDELQNLEQELAEKIGKDGGLFITKDSGLFKAMK
ncbi:MAG: class I SAM-dependent methyltransferase [Anaerolineales bacterium]|nr:class I SAM-dependent methyltransferase [Anaerolineales bacterium]